jgi:hypothetical protein
MSGLVTLARNCSSPISCAYELLRLPLLPSGFGMSFVFRSIGIATGLAFSNPSLFRISLIYFGWEIVIAFPFLAISIPTIFEGLSRSVISHSDCTSSFILLDDANRSKLLTQTMIISRSSPFVHIYAYGSEHKCLKLFFINFSLNLLFHSCPDCFRPYIAFINRQTWPVPSSNPSGWCM